VTWTSSEGLTLDTALLEGHRSIEAALAAQSREVIRILAVNPGDRRLRRLRALARDAGVVIEAVDEARVDELAAGSTHGGVVAIVGPRRYRALDALLEDAGPDPLLVMLDGVEDPFTYGQAVRALYAAGADGLVVPSRTWESAAGVVARSSAGTSELLPTAQVASVKDAADACRAAGLQVVCAVTTPDAMPLQQLDLRRPTLVVIGGERRGITRSFVPECEVRVAIPYARPNAPPLSAAAAAAVIGFEAARQRALFEHSFDFGDSPAEVGERPD
jgi:23S rRNA (guanosine2251-2'-O)-methyltransferase